MRACIDPRLHGNVCFYAVLVLALRRVSGALVHPLSVAMLTPTGSRRPFRPLVFERYGDIPLIVRASSRGDLIMDILLGASLPIFAAALSLPGTNAWGLACLWLLISAFEILAWGHRAGQWLRRTRHVKTGPERLRIDQAQSIAAHIEPVATLPGAISDSLTAPLWPAKGVTQQLTRSTTTQGGDLLCGALRLDLAAGQRTGNLHVAFCPPFAGTPEITAVQADGPEGADKDRPIAALRGPHGCKAHCAKRRTGRRAGAVYGPSRVLNV